MPDSASDPPPDGIYDVTLLYGDVLLNCRVVDGQLYIPIRGMDGVVRPTGVAIVGAYRLTPIVIPDVCPE